MNRWAKRAPTGALSAALSLLGVLLPLWMTGAARGHDLLTAYVQHRIRVTAGARDIDVVVDLTFFEEWSARERGRMDGDGDGRITRDEREAYLKRLAPELAKRVRLRIGGRAVELIPLYEPEVDLLGNNLTGREHHRLRIAVFGSTPAALRPGAEIRIEDALWPEAKALGAVEADGRDGFVLKAREVKSPTFPPARTGEGRVFEVVCVESPHGK